MYKTVAPNGVIVHSTVPFKERRLKDDNAFLFTCWSWKFSIKRITMGYVHAMREVFVK